MRTRHRPPSIFSMSMLDVLCCALGASILLMLLNFVTAYNKTKALALIQGDLKKSGGTVKDLQANLSLTRSDLATSMQYIEGLQQKEKKLAADLQAARRAAAEEQDSLAAKLQSTERDLDATKALLKQAQSDRDAVERLLAQAMSTNKDAIAAAKAARSELNKQNDKLSEATGRIPELQKALDEALSRAEKTQDRATALEADVMRLRKELEKSGLKIAEKEKETQIALDAAKLDANTLRRLLDDQQATSGRLRVQLQQAANRFAGIDLSGKRVVCLVDMSGSMGAVDANTMEPSKWPTVCQTVQQVLKSLPDVEKFQVVVFSDKITYPLGRPGEWVDFERGKSPDEVYSALTRTKPEGNTHLYAAFEAAFRFKPIGLDTIYLFSDGLPNVGPGLPPNPPADETSQGNLLGNHLRETIRRQWNNTGPPVRVHAIGFFYESPALGAFLWSLTRENGGNFVGMSKP